MAEKQRINSLMQVLSTRVCRFAFSISYARPYLVAGVPLPLKGNLIYGKGKYSAILMRMTRTDLINYGLTFKAHVPVAVVLQNLMQT